MGRPCFDATAVARLGRATRRAHGFADVALLLTVALIGLVATHAVQQGGTSLRREAERELLAIGAEFEGALRSYGGSASSAAGVGGAGGPATLDDLLRDPRAAGLRRHLRRIPADPLTGRHDWGLVRGPTGAIVGIHSLAPGVPIQRTGFEPRWAAFEDAPTYADWVFAAAHRVPPQGRPPSPHPLPMSPAVPPSRLATP